jgi:hypothetical protein
MYVYLVDVDSVSNGNILPPPKQQINHDSSQRRDALIQGRQRRLRDYAGIPTWCSLPQSTTLFIVADAKHEIIKFKSTVVAGG